MDSRLVDYYNQELQILRELGAEFAREFPKVASRLGMDGIEVADPYVERLLEGFSFLAARVQMKLDAEFPRFTQHLLEAVYPGYAAPVPSMAIVRFDIEPAEGTLADGVVIPRGSALRGTLGKGEQTPCEFRTAQPVTLWPIEIAEVRALRIAGSGVELQLPPLAEVSSGRVKAAVRLRLRTTSGARFDQLRIDRLALHLTGLESTPVRLHEQLAGHAVAVLVRSPRAPEAWHARLPAESIRAMGFADDEALLPPTSRGFSGYRLLQEYFAFPQRFLFVELTGLAAALRRCADPEVEILVLLDRADPGLDGALDASNVALFCTPAINLFPKRADRIHLVDREYEYPVVPDRTRPMDFEVFDVLEVTGYSDSGERARTFRPFYATHDLLGDDDAAYFTLRRTPRLLSARQASSGPRSGYLGGDVYLALVDAREAPYRTDLRQLGLETLCTNRDLPLLVAAGAGRTDFTLVAGAPVRSIRIVAGPTRPRRPCAENETAWRLIGQLSLNYLTLLDTDERRGAAALRELLGLYGDLAEPAVRKQIEGVRSVAHRAILRRIARGAASAWVHGLEITLTFDESAFQGFGPFPLATVLEAFFARYVSINAFTETVARTTERGEIGRWPARLGTRTPA